MGESRLPRINEVANYLNRFAPSELQGLRDQGPDFAPLLQEGAEGGDNDAADDAKQRKGLLVRADILSTTLEVAKKRAGTDVVAIQRKLKQVRVTRFVAQIAGTLASATLVGMVFANPIAAMITAILSTASNLFGLVGERLLLGGKEDEAKLQEILATLSRAMREGELTGRLLKALRTNTFDTAEMSKVLSGGNELFERLSDAQSRWDAIA